LGANNGVGVATPATTWMNPSPTIPNIGVQIASCPQLPVAQITAVLRSMRVAGVVIVWASLMITMSEGIRETQTERKPSNAVRAGSGVAIA